MLMTPPSAARTPPYAKRGGRKWDACVDKGVDSPCASIGKDTPQHCSVLSRAQASSPGRIILAYRQGGREASVAHHEWGPRCGDDSRMLSSQFSLIPGI